MRTLWRLTRFLYGTARFLLRRGFALVIVVMLALNVGTLTWAPLSAAAGAILARAGVTTVANGLEARLASSNRRIDELRDELATTNRRLTKKTDDLAAASRRLASQADELAAAKRNLTAQADELASVKRQVARQTDEIASLRHVQYRGQTKTVSEAVAHTVGRIAGRTANATARNLVAMPAEAVPLFGIAVIAGATAWEIHDACALMQDLHELNVAFDSSQANDPDRYEACGREVPSPIEVWRQMSVDPGGVLEQQPQEYGPLPSFERPGWWDWAMSWFADEAGALTD